MNKEHEITEDEWLLVKKRLESMPDNFRMMILNDNSHKETNGK